MWANRVSELLSTSAIDPGTMQNSFELFVLEELLREMCNIFERYVVTRARGCIILVY